MIGGTRRRFLGVGSFPVLYSLIAVHPSAGQTDATKPASDHVAAFAINGLVAGVVAGVTNALAGRPIEPAILRGFVGGSIVFLGKEIAVRRFAGAGLVGREIAAVGSSVVQNATRGSPWIEQITLPVAVIPGSVVINTTTGRVRPRVDMAGATFTAYGLLHPRWRVDWAESLSSGIAIFEADGRVLRSGDTPPDGVTVPGAVFLSDLDVFGRTASERASVIRHERIHVLQSDFVHIAWSDLVNERIANALAPSRGTPVAFLTIDTLGWLLFALERATIPDDRDAPTELEATLLAR